MMNMKKLNMRKLKELWKIPKYKSAMKLALYVLMMLVIVVFLNIGLNASSAQKETNKENEIITRTLAELKTELLTGTYEYKYTVENDNKAVFQGSCYQNTCLGYKETINENIKYYSNNQGVFKIVLGEDEEYKDLYQNLNEDYLDINHLLTITNNLDPVKGKASDLLTSYYVLEDANLTIYYTNIAIIKIEINTELDKYILEFNNIGNIKEDSIKW